MKKWRKEWLENKTEYFSKKEVSLLSNKKYKGRWLSRYAYYKIRRYSSNGQMDIFWEFMNSLD